MRNSSKTERSKTETLQESVDRLREIVKAAGRKGSLRDPMASFCEETGYTDTQIHTIFWAGGEGPLTMGELAKRVGVSDKTLTGIVDRLERDDMLARERDSDDRRVVKVRVTERGRVTHARIDKLIDGAVKRALGMLEPHERSTFLALIETIFNRVEHEAVSAHAHKGTAK